MQYCETKMGRLSRLGLGCMRLPKDDQLAEAIVVRAIEAGINYFDTAYLYGDNEERVGRFLAKNQLRDRVNIATKLPLLKLRKAEDIERFFSTELSRLQTDHIDYYLLHMMPDVTFWRQLQEWGIEEWLAKKKATGAIRHVGFSFHGTNAVFMPLLDIYPWEFCLLQHNYIDEFNQAGVAGIKRAYELGMTVMIMEPLLGGRLVNDLPKNALETLAEKQLHPAQFGLNWLWNKPEISVVLSGMNSLEMLEQNLKWVDEAHVGMLGSGDMDLYAQMKEAFIATDRIHCTACNYCTPCPKNVNIPSCFKSYNMSYSKGFYAGLHNYCKEAGITATKLAIAGCCVGCGKCEAHCPQHIKIRQELKNVERRLEPFWFKIAIKVVRKIIKRG